ncbi:hypothetical protein F1880_001246 [Penicillium rolfsii]|nr:hypothetical protein F1880_001246 [Penicillium rolfsii]
MDSQNSTKMNPEIPGFYYDPEKKKYFKIQANHAAPPGAQYSRDSVKRKRDEQEEQKRQAHVNQRIARETVRKPSFLHHPVVGVDREIGSRLVSSSELQDRQASIYASQLRRKRLHNFEPCPGPYNIRHVLRSPRSGILITSTICFPDYGEEKWIYNQTMERLLFREPYRLSSVSLSHTGYVLATFDSGPGGDSFLAPRLLPNPDEDGDYRWPSEFLHPIRIRTTQTLWCSAACPIGDKALFAIGTSDGLHTLEGYSSHWTLSQKPFPNEAANRTQGFRRHGNSSHASVQAVEWLSSDVIASGLRNSTVFLYDVRTGDASLRLQHSQSVTKIRKVDPWRIVVGGHNSVEMYDIRFVAEGLQHKPKPMTGSHISSRPYLSFPDFSPEEIPDLDVSTELGLLACASNDRKLRLFSLNTGKHVPSPISKFHYARPITGICFEATEQITSSQGPQTPCLLVSSEASVDQWIW